MASLKESIERASTRFAREILTLLRGARLAEILELTGRSDAMALAQRGAAAATHTGNRRGGGRTRREPGAQAAGPLPEPSVEPEVARATGRKRTRAEVDRLAELALAFLVANGGEHAVSAIAKALSVSTTDLVLPLQRLRSEGRIASRGQKRSTVYRVQ